jgi:hypothetical protein
MKPYMANLINGAILVVMGLWGYFASEGASFTALIAPAFGVVFLLCTPMMKKENKVVAHIVVLLTLLIIIALIKPLMGADGDSMKILRIGTMMFSSVVAMVVFIKSFIDARKARG